MDDATFTALLKTLIGAPAAIEAQVRRVPAERWDDAAFQGESGWTRRQLLAHMAANDIRQVTRIRVGAGIGGPADRERMEAQGDVHVWNQAQVDARAGRTVDELLTEMHGRRAELIALLEVLTPEQRSREIPFRDRSLPLTEMVPFVLGHLAAHADELAT